MEQTWYREAVSQGWYEGPSSSVPQPASTSEDWYQLRDRGWRRSYVTQLTGGTRGLANMGNTCYMNAVLQCLMHCGMLAEVMLGSEDSTGLPVGIKPQPLTRAFTEALVEHWRSSHELAFRPQLIKSVMARSAPQFAGFEQQDAQEFLVFFLDALHEELNEVKDKAYKEIQDDENAQGAERARAWWAHYESLNQSVVKDIFVGQLCSRVTCSRCGHVSMVFDPFWSLSIPVPDEASCSLAACMHAFIAPENLSGENRFFCGRCRTHTDCMKQMTLSRCPDVIVVHLKRFQTRGASMQRTRSTRGSGFSKLATVVNFPLSDFDLRPFCAQGAHEDTYGYQEPLLYNLIGVVNHYGASGTHGHYTADCFEPRSDQWFHYDDSSVRALKAETMDQRSAYVMLFARATA
ncbi:Ubiquitin carboxyl-terminal hydrolase 2 [Hondaea fermentalgiana]|uniref:Ubiquitin carboxyl-terminal hydrolase n=1 Tax=Hondaea fermentalgiana TaxID=2315210 RepID=A0A2R5GKC7_9STRA|nr:Ubiquitin carboxyl-terminal hydrolase 2 [Hondaea fermentalgiana]|eukprot:GBG31075.1 Ubiquitin carboxyl-terminal hydrolase 2 [Hondaea fermentalgiana]